MKTLILTFVSLFPQLLLGQQGFEKVYIFDDTVSECSNIHVTDSCYYLLNQIGNYTNRVERNFVKLDLNGNVLQSTRYGDSNDFHFSANPYSSKTNVNFRGNLVYSYTVRSQNQQRPYLCEITPSGELFFDSIYFDIWNVDSIFVTFTNFEILPDSNYLLAYKFGDYTNTFGSPYPSVKGTIIFKIAPNGTILWTKKYLNSNTDSYVGTSSILDNLFIKVNIDNTFVFGVRNAKNIAGPFHANARCENYFIYCDQNGNEISRDVFHDTFFTCGGTAYEELPDGTSIFSYQESRLKYPLGHPYNPAQVRNVISHLTTDKQLIWKTALGEGWSEIPGNESMIYDIVIKKNKIFAANTSWLELSEISYRFKLIFYELDLNGNILWKRDYGYFPIDGMQDPVYKINDIDTTLDGGYIMTGNCYKSDDAIFTQPYRYGYVLKTNCLGFMQSPQAAGNVIQTNQTDTAFFQNNSSHAGGFTWYFGDGDSLQTGEDVDTVSHVYATQGEYNVMLIAHGCGTDADTIKFLYSNFLPDTAVVYGNGSLLTVFPNPSATSESLSIYIGKIKNPMQFKITDATGKAVFSKIISTPNMTYFLSQLNLANGMYEFTLFDNGKVVESEKVVVY